MYVLNFKFKTLKPKKEIHKTKITSYFYKYICNLIFICKIIKKKETYKKERK